MILVTMKLPWRIKSLASEVEGYVLYYGGPSGCKD